VEFLAFLKQVARAHPRVPLHVVCDNYATHKHPNVQAWLAKHPRVQLHFATRSTSGRVVPAGRCRAMSRRAAVGHQRDPLAGPDDPEPDLLLEREARGVLGETLACSVYSPAGPAASTSAPSRARPVPRPRAAAAATYTLTSVTPV